MTDEIGRAKQADELRAAIEIEMRIPLGRWRSRMLSPRLGRLEQQGLIAHLLTGLRDGAAPFLNPDSLHFRKWHKSEHGQARTAKNAAARQQRRRCAGEPVVYRALRRVDEAREALSSNMGKARANSNSMPQFHSGLNREFARELPQAKFSRKIRHIHWEADSQ